VRSGPAVRQITAVAAVLWMAVIFGLSSLSGSSVPEGPPALGHFVLYVILGALYYFTLPGDKRGWRVVVLAIVLASAYGVSDEFHQSFVPGRTPDVMDWLVDTAGATLAVLAARAWVAHRWKLTAQRTALSHDGGRPPVETRASGGTQPED